MSEKPKIDDELLLLATFFCHRLYRIKGYFPSIRVFATEKNRQKYKAKWDKLTEICKYFKENHIDMEDYIRVVVQRVQPEIYTPFQLLIKPCRQVWQDELVSRREGEIFSKLKTDVVKFLEAGGPTSLIKSTHEIVFEYTPEFLCIIPNIETLLKKLGQDVFNEAFISLSDFHKLKTEVINAVYKRYNIVPKELSELIAILLSDIG